MQGRLLSVAGRIYLIKSVISVLPLFYFSFFKALVAYTTKSKEFRQSSCGVGVIKVERLPG